MKTTEGGRGQEKKKLRGNSKERGKKEEKKENTKNLCRQLFLLE